MNDLKKQLTKAFAERKQYKDPTTAIFADNGKTTCYTFEYAEPPSVVEQSTKLNFRGGIGADNFKELVKKCLENIEQFNECEIYIYYLYGADVYTD